MLAKACVDLQLDNWEKTLQHARSADVSFGASFGVNLDQLNFVGELGEHAEQDIDVISKAMASVSLSQAQIKDIWTWDKLPYVARCVGLASIKEEEVRQQKKVRNENDECLIPDVDEWYVFYSVQTLMPLVVRLINQTM